MRRALSIVAGSILAYVGISSILHFIVFPEPPPPREDRPRRGTEVHLPDGSTFIYRKTAIETDGEIFEAEWHGDPGAGIARHTHPSQEVRFRIVEGTLRVVADGRERLLSPGDEAIIPAGAEHLWENDAGVRARGIFQLRPAGMADFMTFMSPFIMK